MTVLLLSGGIDSTTLLSHLLAGRHEVYPVSFRYPSKHNQYELAATKQIVAQYSLQSRHKVFDMNKVFEGFQSNLLLEGGEIPEGHYTDPSMAATVVPCRNLIFLSVAAGYACSIGSSHVALGIHSGDHPIYPDCRPEFFKHAERTILEATDDYVDLLAPFLHWTKGGIIERGKELRTPYHLTRTCYKNQTKACGKCGSCVERKEAFAKNEIVDPETYAE